MNLRSIFTLAITAVAALSSSAQQAKYIFFFIGDGMGMGAISAAESYNHYVNGPDSKFLLTSLPVASAAFTRSASSPVTDSAAAGTALATGHKTRNYMIGLDPDSAAVYSIATRLKQEGFGIGIVTSVAPDDATPAAFYAHQPNRSMYYEIGCDAAASGFDFIAGGNLRGKRGGSLDSLFMVMAQNDVQVVRGADALKGITSGKVFLLNTDTTQVKVPHAIDSVADQLTLPIMTQACLDHLMTNSPNRFFMMVEGGSIDHAAHANDAATAVIETLNFDEALQIAFEFYKAHPDETLIVVTADHDTGGMVLGRDGMYSKPDISYLRYVTMSKGTASDYFKSILNSRIAVQWPDMKQFLSDKFGFYTHIPISDDDDAKLQKCFNDTFELRSAGADQQTLYASFGQMAVEVYDIINRAAGIGWTTFGHTGTVVPVFAVGVGAERFNAMLDNTLIPRNIMSIAGFESK